MSLSRKATGIICGITAAICYGTNPLGALALYADKFTPYSVLFYRFLFATIILAVVMLCKKISFKVSLKELLFLAGLGIVFATSSITLFVSFTFMPAGVASTLLFVHPIMVALIMATFFKEKINFAVVMSILLAFCGIAMLYYSPDGVVLNTAGVLLVLLSALSYAVYMITINKSSMELPSLKLNFYVLFFCCLTAFAANFFLSVKPIQRLENTAQLLHALQLAIVPTVLSLCLMTIALKRIGSTSTSIMGALEPLTAVLIGVMIFGEPFSLNLAFGILLILCAELIIVLFRDLTLKRFIGVFKRHAKRRY